MLQRLKRHFSSGWRRAHEAPPVVPERGPATFVARAGDEAQLHPILDTYRAAFDAGDDARLVVVADASLVLDASRLAGGTPPVEIVEEAGDDVLARAFTEEPTSVGRFRRLYTRHQELDELLAGLPALRGSLRAAAAGHPRVEEVDALLDAFVEGYGVYARTGRTPPRADDAMRQLFIITNGALNRAVQAIHSRVHPPAPVDGLRGLLAWVSEEEVAELLANIERDGFHVFSQRAPQELLVELEAFARRTPLLPHPGGTAELRYDEDHPVGTAYYLQPHRVLNDPLVRRLYADTSLLAVAQRILGCQPVLSHLGMWWSTRVGGRAVSEVAQLYHFDMDKPAFIQFFVYLTDVGPENGPHCFVRGSHRERPMALRRDGRIPDEEIRAHYEPDDVVEIHGDRGTIFAVETTAWHKGKPITRGHRLVFQWVYSTGLFGAPHAPLPVDVEVEPDFLEAVRLYPRAFERAVSDRYDFESPRVGRWAVTPG